MAIIYGRAIGGGAGGGVPDIFGDGSDGVLTVSSGQSHTETVANPHYDVVEKQYASLTIEAGGIYTTDACNAGLVIRVQGDCIIHGTIDQSGKAPKTNPDNVYPYPPELVCGAGGNGGNGGKSTATDPNKSGGAGGRAMPARSYGGGYGAGGGGGGSVSANGGTGGSSNTITVAIPDDQLWTGNYGGGGIGGSGNVTARGGDGGDGNYGGGVVMLYVGGNLILDGKINCNGLPGCAGVSKSSEYYGAGGGGGGGGGGSVYILYNKTLQNAGNLMVSGGAGGTGGTPRGGNGTAGTIGTYTILSYDEYMQGQTA